QILCEAMESGKPVFSAVSRWREGGFFVKSRGTSNTQYTHKQRASNKKKPLSKIRFSKNVVRCIMKITKEGDIFEYDRAGTSAGFGAVKIAPVYGR
ncbi:MAG: hypothetical protein NC131_14485, partial [Roseburia sp.]|nr:hypothetical protein [Roseburia sp.]